MDWKQVDQALGKAGALQPDGAHKVGLPRGDLHVSVGGIAVKPALALGSWVAFRQVSDTEVMLMGDLVPLESEAGPVPRITPPNSVHSEIFRSFSHDRYAQGAAFDTRQAEED